MRKRTLGRENALIILYQADISRRAIELSAEKYWTEQESVDETVKKFTTYLILGIDKNLEAINQKITQYATNWQIKRMAIIDRNVMRIGVFEMIYSMDIPPKVAINEAVELAKKYGDTESSKFVNGILDKLHKTELLEKKIVNNYQQNPQ